MKKLLVVGEKSITQPVVPASVTGYQAGFLDLRQPWRDPTDKPHIERLRDGAARARHSNATRQVPARRRRLPSLSLIS